MAFRGAFARSADGCVVGEPAARPRLAGEPGEQAGMAARDHEPVLGFEREFAHHRDQPHAHDGAVERFVFALLRLRSPLGPHSTSPSRMPLAPWNSCCAFLQGDS